MRHLAAALAIFFLAAFPVAFSQAAPEDYAIESVAASLADSQAGAHRDFTTTLELTKDPTGSAFGYTREIHIDLPSGLLANPDPFPHCTTAQLGQAPSDSHCPQDSQVGVVEISFFNLGTFVEPLYLMQPPSDTPARLGIMTEFFPVVINAHVRSEGDYGVTGSSKGIPAFNPLVRANATIWGVPTDPSHDPLRITPLEASKGQSPPGGGRASNLLTPTPFMVNPTRCGVPLQVHFTAISHQLPDQPSTMSASLPSISGCGKLGFEPNLAIVPTSGEAAAPSGLNATLEVPQDETASGHATSHIRHAEVVFPPGMTIAPGAADGQLACSDEQAGYESRRPAQCPNASKLGTVEIDVPALERPAQGALYLRTPVPGDLFRVWLIADDLGVHIALPGDLEIDKATGQISSAFFEMPQAPVRGAKFHVFGGPRGPLATPSACGIYEARWKFTPWSGTAPVGGPAPLRIDRSCDTGGFSPKLSAGAASPVAGAFSSFITDLTRQSGEQNIRGVEIDPPPGLLAKLAGVALCEGVATQTGQCPTDSQVARVIAAVGPGPAPLWLPQPGRDPIVVFLAGPYLGAPYSLVVKAPAQAGPFDLGTVITRAAIHVDPDTARVTIRSDPLPQILEGVPISYRRIHVHVDRPGFTVNPTSCRKMEIASRLISDRGAIASPAADFQVGSCRELGFRPRLSLRLFGKANRGAHPRLRAVLKLRRDDANISRASVALPRSEFIDQSHIRTVCTRVQFAADACPEGSIYGHARAFTPLLDEPLQGPVYLRSSDNLLPDMVLALRGKVDINAVGRIDSVRGGIRTTFEAVPDAPVSKVVVTMQGGRKGLIVNSRNLCKALAYTTVNFRAHSGRQRSHRPVLRHGCA